MPTSTIVALATPWGRSAIAVIRVSGNDCLSIINSVFNSSVNLLEIAEKTILYGNIVENDTTIDQVIILVYIAPKSYTGEHMIEICCHGNPIIIHKIIALLLVRGCVEALPGEFTQRALLNGKIDLTTVEALPELIRANTYNAYDNAMQHMSGQVYKVISAIKQQLLKILGAVNIQLDYPIEESGTIVINEEELLSIQQKISSIISSYDIGRIFTDGIKLMIFGKPNAGKSTLFNLLLSQERAITSETEGTTRDYLQCTVEIAGIPVELYDTAGIRERPDPIEAQGIKKSLELLQEAHIILYLIDAQYGVSEIDISYINKISTTLVNTNHRVPVPFPLIIINKTDLSEDPRNIQLLPTQLTPLYMSAKDGFGHRRLTERLQQLIQSFAKTDDSEYRSCPIITSARQKTLLTKALSAIKSCTSQINQQDDILLPLDMLTLDIEEAIDALGQITGEVTKDDILEMMFANYCVGK